MYTLIHKPQGVEIQEKTINLLSKKYNGDMQFLYLKEKVWHAPVRLISDHSIKTTKEAYEAETESVIIFNSMSGRALKKTNFFFEDKDSGEWAMGIVPPDLSFMEEGGSYSSEKCKESVFIENLMQPLCNESRVRLIKFFSEKCNVNIPIVTAQNDLQIFGPKMYKVDGVSFSSLEHEDFLTYTQKGFVAAVLAWEMVKTDKNINLKTQIDDLSKKPHRILMNLLKKNTADISFLDKLV